MENQKNCLEESVAGVRPFYFGFGSMMGFLMAGTSYEIAHTTLERIAFNPIIKFSFGGCGSLLIRQAEKEFEDSGEYGLVFANYSVGYFMGHNFREALNSLF